MGKCGSKFLAKSTDDTYRKCDTLHSVLLLLQGELMPQALQAMSKLSLFSINALYIYQLKIMALCCS